MTKGRRWYGPAPLPYIKIFAENSGNLKGTSVIIVSRNNILRAWVLNYPFVVVSDYFYGLIAVTIYYEENHTDEKEAPKTDAIFSNLSHVFKHIPIIIRKYLGEIVTGVVIGIIILIVTPFVNNAIENQAARQRLVNNLSSVSLGMSKNYIDELFGQPIIETGYEKTVTWYSDYQTEESFISAGYKLKSSVLLCLYCDKSLVAFVVVVVNEAHLYRIPANMYLDDCYLLDFTYFDFSETVDTFEGNVPANNDTYAYYSELYYGAGPADYNYFIIGSYKDCREKADAYALMHMGQAYALNDDDLYPYDRIEL